MFCEAAVFSATLRVAVSVEKAGCSLTLVTLMVMSMVSSTTVSALPPASFLSLTETMTEYKDLVSKSRAPLVRSWPLSSTISKEEASVPPRV